MPFVTDPVSANYISLQPLPQHLDHKPVYAMPYQHFDGISPPGTDARYISIGNAQYNQNDVKVDIPAGTFTNQKIDILVSQEQRSFGEVASYNNFLAQDAQLLKARLNALLDLLGQLKQSGKI